ncbi:MAG: TonB-dependent receptor [Candidatus Acidiferrales bacterium]
MSTSGLIRIYVGRAFFALLGVSLLILSMHPMAAQTDRATLEGTVGDPSRAIIAGASVTVTEVSTGIAQVRKTNSNGYYLFPGLAVGAYTVTVSNPGFKAQVLQNVVLRVGETHTLDIQLSVGEVSEKVVVNAEAEPAERTLAAQSSVITSAQIAELPSNGRDWASFTMLAPFAQDDGGGDQRTIRFAGHARDDNNFSFDGVDAGGIQEQAQKSSVRLQISPDAVAEYRVNSALYDAEYGTQDGGQVNVVTKSGTNDYHGSVFGYFRNSIFDARNFNDATVLPFRMGQYGLTFGGPIQKDKTFFFLSYEGLRQLQAATSNPIPVPSASLVQDILVNGRNGQGPSPQMCAILQGFPWRSSTGTVGGCTPKIVFPDSFFSPCPGCQVDSGDSPTDIENFTHQVGTTIHEDTWLARLDHKFSDKTSLYIRAQRDISLVVSQIGVTDGFDSNNTFNHPGNYVAALQHIFSPNIFNETKVYINRAPFHNPVGSPLTFAVNTDEFVGIPNQSADIEVGTTFGVVDNLTWTHGRNAFAMGVEYRRVRLNQGQTADNNLTFTDNQSLISASLAAINFNAPWCCHGLRRNFFMPYFQDAWKMTPTFTVTAGVRWEVYGAPTEATNRTTVFDFNQFHGACLGSGSGNTPFPAPINTPPCPTNPYLTNTDYRDVDPRLSLAWAPSDLHGKTVFRAGFGIYHGAAQNDDLNAGLESDTFRVSIVPPSGSIPLIPAYEQAIPDLSSFTGTNGLQKAAAHPRALQREDRRNLYSEEWGLTIEHQLPSNLLLSVSYLGSHGVRLFNRGAVNLCNTPVVINPNTGDCVRPLDQYFPDPNNPDPYGSVDFKSDIGSSFYDALGLALQRHMDNGLSFEARYTFSHSINDGSVGGGESNGPENVNCLACDKGPSVFDVRHNFVADVIYALPFGPGARYLNDSGAVGKFLGGWQLSSVGMYHTGHPLTVTMRLPGNDVFLLPDGNDQTDQRPDLVPGVPLTLPGGGRNGIPLINPAAFQAPPVDANGNFTRYGNAGTGLIRALPSWQIDLALMKDTHVTERFTLEFGVQAFNIFNHAQLGDPGELRLNYDPSASATGFLDPRPNFGVIDTTVNFNNNNDNDASPNTGTGLPRQLQFMVRFKF